MKKKSLFLGGALMFAMTFSTTVLTSCHDDDNVVGCMKKWKTR